jgi:hypothetical protein
VQEIGQGFADELYRVWAATTHRAIKVSSVHMNQAVAFMVRRAGGRRSFRASAGSRSCR